METLAPQLIEALKPILLGVVTNLLIQWAKRAESIPLNAGQKGKIRMVAAGLSLVGSLLVNFTEGSLSSEQSVSAVTVLVDAGIGWLIAHSGYKILQKPNA